MDGETAVGSMWSLLPPIIAIGLALITKEVYSSLFIGIVSGGIIAAVSLGTGFEGFMSCVVKDGVIQKQEIGFRSKEAVYDMLGIYPDMK